VIDRGAYVGRFAPSPTGPLHAGSLVAALASWLDARAHGGQWLVRIEDVDTMRCVPGTDQIILQQLAACGLHPDAPPVYQSQRGHLYQKALDQLIAQSQAYPCGCSRQAIQEASATASPSTVQGASEDSSDGSDRQRERHAELVYPGTCRGGLSGKKARSWRFLTEFYSSSQPAAQQIRVQADTDLIANTVSWTDRRLGPQAQNVSAEVGDFVLKRADGLWAYQLAVVVDDAAQGVTHIVRGEDLADNTARQILLQRALGLLQPAYLHAPLVLAADGQKLSKQNGALSLDISDAIRSLQAAGELLGLQTKETHHQSTSSWLTAAIALWQPGMTIANRHL
jgi:glutamyl-Q tRNA(Asp) synthetase